MALGNSAGAAAVPVAENSAGAPVVSVADSSAGAPVVSVADNSAGAPVVSVADNSAGAAAVSEAPSTRPPPSTSLDTYKRNFVNRINSLLLSIQIIFICKYLINCNSRKLL
jgi:hypothetical protein